MTYKDSEILQTLCDTNNKSFDLSVVLTFCLHIPKYTSYFLGI